MSITRNLLIYLVLIFSSLNSYARDQIRIVGSSSVYPFATILVEDFAKNTKFKTPIVEVTGTGGGINLFCLGVGDKYPDIANASRSMTPAEKEVCNKNGVNDILEVKFGYDGIIFAGSKQNPISNLSSKEIRKAIAKYQVIDGDIITNPYEFWDEINNKLPHLKIEIYGPSISYGTRDIIEELFLKENCINDKIILKNYPHDKERGAICKEVREDGKYIEIGKNENLIIQKLKNSKNIVGIFGYQFYKNNQNMVKAFSIDNIVPNIENIAEATYSARIEFYQYFKLNNRDYVLGIAELAKYLVSDEMIGKSGILTSKGMISLPANELVKLKARVNYIK